MMNRILLLCLIVSLTSGCAALHVRVDANTEKRETRRVLAKLNQAETPPLQAQWLAYGLRNDLTPTQKVSALSQSARLALPGATRDISSKDAEIYAIAVRAIVAELYAQDFKDMDLEFSSLEPNESIQSGLLRRLIVARGSENNQVDPSTVDSIYAADTVSIRGLLSRAVVDGIGVPYVAELRPGNPLLKGQPGIPKFGLTIPLTAYLTFENQTARIVFRDPTDSTSVKLAGKSVPLAADFSAPLAVLIAKGPNRALDPRAMFFSDTKVNRAGLLQIHPYDPEKIPVVFVHGLLSRPEAWTRATNELLADPVIRKKYQFWYFLYPTGLPVWASAAILRDELDRFQSAVDPKARSKPMQEMVLVGHSMGGLISSMLIREGGNKLWMQFSDTSLEKLDLAQDLLDLVDTMINFRPRSDISRVVFMATPHKGSPLALRPIAGFVSGAIRLPFELLARDRTPIVTALREDVRGFFVAPANSIQFLRSDSPLLSAILRLPMSERVRFHSIIGDRGRGDSPNSSDGVVPFWSSSLPGAKSETIVPSNHGVNENPGGIKRLRQILVNSEEF